MTVLTAPNDDVRGHEMVKTVKILKTMDSKFQSHFRRDLKSLFEHNSLLLKRMCGLKENQ